ncbi:SAM-dependent methyltransferase [Hamadaea flava]|uniref:Methyltransferase domain-containing protein n=1 Tax=Hamadaea flava TaxID=1742688 RepID=A0ABV8LSQ8_9ACTN|nr:class I SAM-dependent methyltransferase [Hamadaea flava]MCP2328702.1 SAM-dependent methyltransferase [Hamadaea flava]
MVGIVTTNEDTYGGPAAALYDEFFPIDSRALNTAAFLSGQARATGAAEPIALDLGIGTGRVALPLSERGVKVFGVDLEPAMLDVLRTKPGADRLHATLGDMTDADLLASASEGVPYDLVYCVFGTLTALPDANAQRRCLAAAASVLAPAGRLVLEMPVPDLSSFDKQGRRVRHLGRRGDGTVLETGRLNLVTQTIEFEVSTLSPTTGVTMHSVHSRYVWPHELELMAELAGLQSLEQYGGYGGESFTRDSQVVVTVHIRQH